MSTKIEWTDETWNPIIGCSKVSPGCDNCYAEKMAVRLANIQSTSYYQAVTVHKAHTPPKSWNGKTYFVEHMLDKPLKRKKPTKYFVCSMEDLFHETVPFEWILQVFEVIEKCPQHTFQILTKRTKRMKEFSDWLLEGDRFDYTKLSVWAMHNVWLGVTAENQEQANKRIPILLNTPAAVRFVSIEPMLSEIDFYKLSASIPNDFNHPWRGGPILQGIDWVICGGESGHKARPMHPDWVRSIRDQCQEAKVPFFFKQWGSLLPDCQSEPEQRYNHKYFQSPNNPDKKNTYYKIGKSKTGCLLDNQEYKQFPKQTEVIS